MTYMFNVHAMHILGCGLAKPVRELVKDPTDPPVPVAGAC